MQPFELNKIIDLKTSLGFMEETHKTVVGQVDNQIRTIKGTAEQMIQGYKMYGLENGLKAAGDFLNSSNAIPGLNKVNELLNTPSVDKLIALPELGSALSDRMTHSGHEVPLPQGDEVEDDSQPSILPNTPHPQHSYKENSKRVLNRTGNKRPELSE